MIAATVLLRCSPVSFGSLFVLFGSLLMHFFRHNISSLCVGDHDTTDDALVRFNLRRYQAPVANSALFCAFKKRQYCPVNLRGIGEKANSGAAFRMTKGVSDLN